MIRFEVWHSTQHRPTGHTVTGIPSPSSGGLGGSAWKKNNDLNPRIRTPLSRCFQVVSSIDAMAKYTLEAEKYRSQYLPPSSLAMYSTAADSSKYGVDSSPGGGLAGQRPSPSAYLDSTSAFTKAYLESSKMYMEASKAYASDHGGLLRPAPGHGMAHASHYPLDIQRVSAPRG